MSQPSVGLPVATQYQNDLATYLDDARFSRRLQIPLANGDSIGITVTYSDFGYRNESQPCTERVLLFCSPLMGSRFLHVAKDALAKQHHVRMIVPDRPGFGGTTNVPISQRVTTWLKIVPALLEHLNVKHVSIAAHSGGTIYALNTVLYLRHLLHPLQPYIALCSPWVHPVHSNAPLSRLLYTLPVGVVQKFHSVERFINTKVQPAIGFSTGLSAGLSQGLGVRHRDAPGTWDDERESIAFEEKLVSKVLARLHAENVEGLSSEALLLLKRTGDENVWGDWNDVDAYVPLLAAIESKRDRYANSAPLSVEVFFSASDNMIGTGPGPRWWDDCWRTEQRGDNIDYQSRFVSKTDHDNILNIEFGIANHICSKVPEHGVGYT